ncbi:methyltransferase domain-containing protein [Synechococcus sp. CBW1107]|uniref:methyltransferase domain-containing protein n=1 Tax=Synechococcus sp. CBW1107 TaxID=2789857 RepID=UPI002AD3A9C1|nr:methyltransferase domain-containing protein [Synechococcus sp. CBW1107]CAK6698875.1 2-methoxy-6-polyprenyl-1,4-benzoquinol methylase, mitochondrial [Synechococcus sp. CBW1107]
MNDAAPDSLAVGFRDVDATAPDKIIRCLDCLQAMAVGRAYKARALDLLGLEPGASALDVACGLGDDVVRMKARGVRAVGVDRSRTLIAAAQSRHAGSGCEFVVADAADLPFADGSFDAVRIDRSLQHITDPGRIVREMARVAGRGSVVLCAEPDWGTFLLGGRHCAVSERIQHDWIRTFQNPWIGRELSGLLADAGVVDIRQDAVWLPTHGFAESDLLFEVDANARHLSAELPEALSWLEAYRRGEAYAGVLMLICWGRKH